VHVFSATNCQGYNEALSQGSVIGLSVVAACDISLYKHKTLNNTD